MKAAGIIYLTADGLALFLKRGLSGDMAGSWCWPGGKSEEGETSEETAIREAREEAGNNIPEEHQLQLWTRTTSTYGEEEVEFTTYLQRIEKPFNVAIDDESIGAIWCPLNEPPQPLHPGCEVSLRRFNMDELDVARAMATGELDSPQRYENVWLFNLRITGTKVAYRQALEEFVWRDPSHYMNERFVARCNGLPVIWEHPPTATLTSEEYAKRNVGSIFLPYLREEDQEVWGIAKIYDKKAIEQMVKSQLSTSPTVVFKSSDNLKTEMEDGDTLLIEGKPSLLDHVAICEQGVWDKGGDPRGIEARVDSQTSVDWGKRRKLLDPEKLRRLNGELIMLKLDMSCHQFRKRV